MYKKIKPKFHPEVELSIKIDVEGGVFVADAKLRRKPSFFIHGVNLKKQVAQAVEMYILKERIARGWFKKGSFVAKKKGKNMKISEKEIVLKITGATKPKSLCICGHTGDGPRSGHGGLIGHGPCNVCLNCRRFTWKEWTKYGKSLRAKTKVRK